MEVRTRREEHLGDKNLIANPKQASVPKIPPGERNVLQNSHLEQNWPAQMRMYPFLHRAAFSREVLSILPQFERGCSELRTWDMSSQSAQFTSPQAPGAWEYGICTGHQ